MGSPNLYGVLMYEFAVINNTRPLVGMDGVCDVVLILDVGLRTVDVSDS